MAGLLAARVLADRYESVVVLDRDSFPTSAENRRGVPQGRHTHGLLAGGREALEKLFPGISGELIAAGAVSGDITRNSRWFLEGGCHTRFQSGLEGLLMSRPFLECAIRERVRRMPNVQFRENTEVHGLVTSEQGRVVGARVGTETVGCDLLVDAAGRGSHSPQWLEGLGYPKPPEERVEIALSYTTRVFQRHDQDLNGDMAVIIPPSPFGKRGGVMLAQENGRWTVTLISHFGPNAPAELDGFIEFARWLPAPYIHEVVRRAEPIGEPAVSRFPASIRRRYEKLDRFPPGYLVMGDALSSFNPIYGQGMSVAVLEAMALKAALAEGTEGLARRFFQRASKVIDIPWNIAVGNDLRMPEARGPRTFGIKVINAYVAKLHKAAHRDAVAALAFHQVGNLLKPPSHILRPRVALHVLWSNLHTPSKPVPLTRTVHADARS
jgi:2-polyprenyl-6-methoxyphenol hydroxylase-like FAD-dependent oxidoreductase